MVKIPEVKLSSAAGQLAMPVIGLGSAVDGVDPVAIRTAVLEAIKLGYRHFDTAYLYGTEQALGEAIAEALKEGLVGSRDELFVTSKVWCNDCHHDLVVPAIKKSLQNLQLEYLDLYLIHWPMSSKPGKSVCPIPVEELMPMDFRGVWEAMEESQKLGLTKSIGVSNFSCKKLENILSFATIPPSVNQVEMNPVWRQKKLVDFCECKGIVVTAFSPLGAKGCSWGANVVMDNEVLKGIAEARGKTIAQVALRWIFEQGATIAVKSFNKERMKQNLEIFDWALTGEDYEKINKIPEQRIMPKDDFITPNGPGPYKSLDELWDGEI